MYDQISYPAVRGGWNYPTIPIRERTKDTEMGGLAIGDPSKGLMVRAWLFWIETQSGVSSVVCAPIDQKTQVNTIYTGALNAEITEVGGSFDRLMNPVIAFREGGVVKIRFYDPVSEAWTVRDIGADAVTPCVTHDDKRDDSSATSDVLITYIRGDKLICLRQRDRYGVEIEVNMEGAVFEGKEILTFGMTDALRVQWEYGYRTYYNPVPY